MNDLYDNALSQLHNMILPSAVDQGNVELMAKAAEIEALLICAESLRKIAAVLEHWDKHTVPVISQGV